MRTRNHDVTGLRPDAAHARHDEPDDRERHPERHGAVRGDRPQQERTAGPLLHHHRDRCGYISESGGKIT